MTDRINWTRQHILFALRDAGTSLAAVAASAGLSRFTLYGALERPYPRAQDLIAGALKLDRQTIWPQFYDRSGARLSAADCKRNGALASRTRRRAA